MIKVCFFLTTLNSGGIENYLLRFLKYYENDIAATVFCKGGEYGELEKEYRNIQNIRLVKLHVGYYDLRAYFKIYQLIKKESYDSVCDFTGNFAGIILLVAKLSGVKRRISFYRGSTNHFKETKLRLLYNKAILALVKRNATKILSNSKTALDFFYPERDINDKRFKVIYNGIDAKQFIQTSTIYTKSDFEIPENGYVVGHTGRYNSAKNHKTIIKVAEILCAKYDNIYFILCGKNTDHFLAEIISNNDVLKDKVKVLGFRSNIQNILPVFDLFFFPSITEGQPNSLIEAMIVGLPIVASDIEAIKETTPEFIHKELHNPLNIKGFEEEIEKKYLSRDNKPQNDISEWAIKQFDAKVLFDQFYYEL